MKEASGELSMTLIVIVAAGAILAIFLAFRQPIFDLINNKWNDFGNKTDEQDDWLPTQPGIIVKDYYLG